jgi:hypothetical protein
MDRPPDEVEDGRWLSYAEIAAARGINKLSAERLVRRHRWRRQPDNQGGVRIFVPLTWVESPAQLADTDQADSGPDVKPDIEEAVAALEAALAVLADQLMRERARADAAEARADMAVTREDELRDEIKVIEVKLAGSEGEPMPSGRRPTGTSIGRGRRRCARCSTKPRRRRNGPGRALRRPRTMSRRYGKPEEARRGRGRWARLQAAWRGGIAFRRLMTCDGSCGAPGGDRGPFSVVSGYGSGSPGRGGPV